jgi:hypothetical protein
MADRRDPESQTEREVKREAAVEPDDPTTAREELELELMDEGESAAGTEIGEETP